MWGCGGCRGGDSATSHGHLIVVDRLRKVRAKEEVTPEMVPTDIICSSSTPVIISLRND